MSSPIISVKNIGKKYKLGATLGGRNYKTLRDVLTQAAFSSIRKVSAAFRKEPSTGSKHSSINTPITQSPNNQNALRSAPCSLRSAEASPHEFWALKDISFDVRQGEIVGIIGANGAGKSTLLKILCGITEPTEGEIHIKGRIASLLEVGTGFHPELSGRENIFMNGAILGMTRAEILAKFDEIVAFAEVAKFIDTPVKRYSSGMYVRLAFAVAAHLEPEILLVDEVLAVGDVGFQKKCLGKMGDVAKRGRTVLFVSHNMTAIARLCPTCLLVDQGRIAEWGKTRETIDIYLSSDSAIEPDVVYARDSRKPMQITRVRVLDHMGRPSVELDRRKPFRVVIEFQAQQALERVNVGFSLETNNGVRILDSLSADALKGVFLSCEPNTTYVAQVGFPGDILLSGHYRFRVTVDDYVNMVSIDTRWPCTISLNDFDGELSAYTGNPSTGILALSLPWKIRSL